MQIARTATWVLAILLTSCGAKSVRLDETNPPGNTGPTGSGGASGTNPAVPGASVVVADQDPVVGLAVDDTRVYWHTAPSERLGGSFVRSCLKSDCASSVKTYDSIGWTGPLTGRFDLMAVGPSSLYWLRWPTMKPADSPDPTTEPLLVRSCAKSGCSGAPLTVATSLYFSSMVVDEEHLYWGASSDTAIIRCSLSDCANSVEAAALNQAEVGALAVNATHVYWVVKSGSANSAVMRALKDGTGQPETIAHDQNQAWALTLDAQYVYWTNHYSIGTISRCPLAGCSGPPDVLISNQDYPFAIVADGSKVFWTNSSASGIMTVLGCVADTCSSTVDVLGSPPETWGKPVQPLAIDDTFLYWISQSKQPSDGFSEASIQRMRK